MRASAWLRCLPLTLWLFVVVAGQVVFWIGNASCWHLAFVVGAMMVRRIGVPVIAGRRGRRGRNRRHHQCYTGTQRRHTWWRGFRAGEQTIQQFFKRLTISVLKIWEAPRPENCTGTKARAMCSASCRASVGLALQTPFVASCFSHLFSCISQSPPKSHHEDQDTTWPVTQ